MYGLQHGLKLAQTEQQTIKGPRMTSIKQSKQKTNGLIYINEKMRKRINHINK